MTPAKLWMVEAIMFSPPRPDFLMYDPCQHRHFSLRTNTTRISMKFDEGNHYHQQITFRGEIVQGKRTRENIRIDVKPVLPRSERLYKFHSTCRTLGPQGWRVHYTHMQRRRHPMTSFYTIFRRNKQVDNIVNTIKYCFYGSIVQLIVKQERNTLTAKITISPLR